MPPKWLMGAGKIKRFDHLDKTKDLAAIRTGTAGSREQTPTRAPAPWHAPRSGQTDLSHHCVSRQRSRVRAPSSPLPLQKAVILRMTDPSQGRSSLLPRRGFAALGTALVLAVGAGKRGHRKPAETHGENAVQQQMGVFRTLPPGGTHTVGVLHKKECKQGKKQ